jgi:hypothetical protein
VSTAKNRYSKRNPCPICGGGHDMPQGRGTRCWGLTDDTGDYARCTREELAGAIKQNDDDTYSHLLHGACRCGKEHGLAVPKAAASVVRGNAELVRTSSWRAYRPDGNLAIHRRWDYSDGKKSLAWFHPDGRASQNGEIHSTDRLYGLACLDRVRPALLVEGEKAADAVRAMVGDKYAVLATACGAPTVPDAEVLAYVAGKVGPGGLTIWADNDAQGAKQMEGCAAAVLAHNVTVRRVTWPDAPAHGDAADYCATHGKDELLALLESAKLWTAASAAASAIDDTLISAESLKPKPISWIWANRIARGKMTVAGGDPGGGKSMLSVDWAARMSTGRKWPDGTQAPKCKSALVSAEDDPEDTIVPRLIAAGAQLSMIAFPRALDLSTAADPFFESCKSVGVEVVFIDPISAFVGPDTNTWRDSDMRRFLKPIAEAAARTNIAVVLIVHLTKANGGKALYRFQGSIAQAAAPRMAFLIAAHPNDPEIRVMAAVKNNIGRKAESLSYRITPQYVAAVEDEIGRIEWLGPVALTDSELLQPEAASKAVGRAIEFLLEYLNDGPRPSDDCKAAAKAQHIGRDPLWEAKSELHVKARKDGLERWLWELPERRRDPDASVRFEPSDQDPDASVRFSSDLTPSSHITKDTLSLRTILKHPNHTDWDSPDASPIGPRCVHLRSVLFADDLLTCQDCGQQRDPSEEWPA